jgi:hypothetical protein
MLIFFRDTVPIAVVRKVLNLVSMNKWHFDRINEVKKTSRK